VAAMERVQERVLWLAIRMIDFANREREAGEIKVGGHQASSASAVTIMTALWFGHLDRWDKVAVKPHASPVYHAIKYLIGEIDRSYLTRLRQFGGLQAYPSRTKDPDVRDFSTGSVGLGAVAPLFAAGARRYLDDHFSLDSPGRFISLVGDAELDEGNVWEALAEPATAGLGRVMLVVDTNRQSLDRIVPGIKARSLIQQFRSSGWHVAEAKYGRRLQSTFREPAGQSLREYIDDMSNEEYQRLLLLDGAELRRRMAESKPALHPLLDSRPDDELRELFADLGGHDVHTLLEAFRECDRVTDRPSVVFAYTIKGWRLPIAGQPLNHAALLTPVQIEELRTDLGIAAESEWDRFDENSREGVLCAQVGKEMRNPPSQTRPIPEIPTESGIPTKQKQSTQEAFGRALVHLAADPVGERIVTVSPDVAVSTNLGGWINRVGVYGPGPQPTEDVDTGALRWAPAPSGRHIELGISEMNLFLFLSQLGLSFEHHAEVLFPIGTVYDPFICRGLDAFIYGLYSDARFMIVGTPSGVTLAPEGGAHQSSITPSIGIELPGLTFSEPSFAQALDWLVCDGLRGMVEPDGGSTYLRLSTRPIDQTPFRDAEARLGRERLRREVLAGGYRLREPGLDDRSPLVYLFASGAVMPEVLMAAEILEEEGVAAAVVDATSVDRLFRGWRRSVMEASRNARSASEDFHVAHLLLPGTRDAPIVTVHDSASHAMAWIGSVFGARTFPVGVDTFGQSGSVAELYGVFDLQPEQIVNTALVAFQ
jgi:pyruvate dehydrogenase E1 component